tara:strand:- start:2864 stop:2992 length:129 start_codon:yes stop_codon:yes gene_type:complete
MKYLCNKCNEHIKKEDMFFDTEYDCDLCKNCLPNKNIEGGTD